MTREEQIEQEAKKYVKDIVTPLPASLMTAFINGAEWADEHPRNPQLSAADRGIIDEIIFALNSLSKEKMISYHKEIEFLNKIRKL
jgi:hypothetical protein